MRSVLIRVLTGVGLVLAMAAPAAAQGARTADGVLIDLGLSIATGDELLGDTGVGFKAGLSKALSQMNNGNVAVFGDFSYHDFDGFNVIVVNGGPQVNFVPEGAKVRVFARFGVGITRFGGFGDSQTELSFLPGGGAAFAINDQIEAFGQYDFVIVRFDGGSENANRFTFGIVIRR